jgi:hypothetical protein
MGSEHARTAKFIRTKVSRWDQYDLLHFFSFVMSLLMLFYQQGVVVCFHHLTVWFLDPMEMLWKKKMMLAAFWVSSS